MTWTAPRTWVTGETVTASHMNVHVRDNLLETMPAKVTTAGDLVQATAANALARLAIGSTGQYLGSTGSAAAWSTIAGAIKKPSDESISSETIQNDNDFVFAIGVNEWWFVEMRLYVTLAVAGGLKYDFTASAGTIAGWYGNIITGGLGSFSAVGSTISAGTFPATSCQLLIWAALSSDQACNLQFRWARNAADATATVVKQNSTMRKGLMA